MASEKTVSVATDRIDFLIGKMCVITLAVREPDGETPVSFVARLLACEPLGRDYFFVVEQSPLTGMGRPVKGIVKTGAVLHIYESQEQ